MDNALLNKDICFYREINFHLHVKIRTNSLANPIILHKLSIKKTSVRTPEKFPFLLFLYTRSCLT